MASTLEPRQEALRAGTATGSVSVAAVAGTAQTAASLSAIDKYTVTPDVLLALSLMMVRFAPEAELTQYVRKSLQSCGVLPSQLSELKAITDITAKQKKNVRLTDATRLVSLYQSVMAIVTDANLDSEHRAQVLGIALGDELVNVAVSKNKKGLLSDGNPYVVAVYALSNLLLEHAGYNAFALNGLDNTFQKVKVKVTQANSTLIFDKQAVSRAFGDSNCFDQAAFEALADKGTRVAAMLALAVGIKATFGKPDGKIATTAIAASDSAQASASIAPVAAANTTTTTTTTTTLTAAQPADDDDDDADTDSNASDADADADRNGVAAVAKTTSAAAATADGAGSSSDADDVATAADAKAKFEQLCRDIKPTFTQSRQRLAIDMLSILHSFLGLVMPFPGQQASSRELLAAALFNDTAQVVASARVPSAGGSAAAAIPADDTPVSDPVSQVKLANAKKKVAELMQDMNHGELLKFYQIFDEHLSERLLSLAGNDKGAVWASVLPLPNVSAAAAASDNQSHATAAGAAEVGENDGPAHAQNHAAATATTAVTAAAGARVTAAAPAMPAADAATTSTDAGGAAAPTSTTMATSVAAAASPTARSSASLTQSATASGDGSDGALPTPPPTPPRSATPPPPSGASRGSAASSGNASATASGRGSYSAVGASSSVLFATPTVGATAAARLASSVVGEGYASSPKGKVKITISRADDVANAAAETPGRELFRRFVQESQTGTLAEELCAGQTPLRWSAYQVSLGQTEPVAANVADGAGAGAASTTDSAAQDITPPWLEDFIAARSAATAKACAEAAAASAASASTAALQ